MAKSQKELCGTCCKGSRPIRKSFNECRLCECGAPFFSQIVAENNLPTSRRCQIEIPREVIEDHGYRFDNMDKTVILEEEESESEVHIVKIGGNNFVGFGFEWRNFSQLHNIEIGQIIVFTLVAPKIEHDGDDDDDIEICVTQDWLAARASKSSMTYPVLASKVKVENVIPEISTEQATRPPEKYGTGIDAKGNQKCETVPKVEADSEVFDEGYSVQPTLPKESPVFSTSPREEGEEKHQASSSWNSSEDEGNEDSGSPSTSDSAWSPRKFSPRDGRRRNAKRGAYDGSDTCNEDEDVVSNKVGRRGKRLFPVGSSSVDKTKSKKVRTSDIGAGAETDCPNSNDEDETIGKESRILVEGYIVKKDGHEWLRAGTESGRTYVSRRRPVSEAEKQKTLDRARQVHINNPSFLKQLHKGSCYRSLILFPPTPFYRDHMISATKGQYRATLEDEIGNKWAIRITGMKVFWKKFTLDHNLEEDDVVVFELVDPRPESVRYLVHIFRVVDIKKPVTGKQGWAVHYDVVEGTKKQYHEERRQLLKAQGLKKQKKQKHKRKDGSSSNSKSDADTTEFTSNTKNPDVTEFDDRRASGTQDRLQKEKPAPDSPNASRNHVETCASWKRPTTRIISREMNQSSGELLTKHGET